VCPCPAPSTKSLTTPSRTSRPPRGQDRAQRGQGGCCTLMLASSHLLYTPFHPVLAYSNTFKVTHRPPHRLWAACASSRSPCTASRAPSPAPAQRPSSRRGWGKFSIRCVCPLLAFPLFSSPFFCLAFYANTNTTPAL
jgi:hypothetical protein